MSFFWTHLYAAQQMPSARSQPAPASTTSDDTNETMSSTPPQDPALEVNLTSYLPFPKREGWVTFEDHVVHLKWVRTVRIPLVASNKAFVEKVCAEAAVIKGQAEVEI